jgi:hypothetical protein
LKKGLALMTNLSHDPVASSMTIVKIVMMLLGLALLCLALLGLAWLGLLVDGESSLKGLGNNNKIVSPASFYLSQALDWVSLWF